MALSKIRGKVHFMRRETTAPTLPILINTKVSIYLVSIYHHSVVLKSLDCNNCCLCVNVILVFKIYIYQMVHDAYTVLGFNTHTHPEFYRAFAEHYLQSIYRAFAEFCHFQPFLLYHHQNYYQLSLFFFIFYFFLLLLNLIKRIKHSTFFLLFYLSFFFSSFLLDFPSF